MLLNQDNKFTILVHAFSRKIYSFWCGGWILQKFLLWLGFPIFIFLYFRTPRGGLARFAHNSFGSCHIIQWNHFSEDTSVAESHGYNIMFWIFPTMVEDRKYLGEFPIHFIFFVRAKWVTTTKFGEKLANLPLAALLFIVFFLFDSQIHWTFIKFWGFS